MAGINGFGNSFNNYSKNFKKLTLNNNKQNTAAKINAQPLSLTPKTMGDNFNISLNPETQDNNGIVRQEAKKSFKTIWYENYCEHLNDIGGTEMLPSRYRDNDQMAFFDTLYVTIKSGIDWLFS